jgi:glycosyltransferase involved in cell wall biosynthesis
MMNQNRAVNMIKRLALDHQIDLLTSDTNDHKLLSTLIPGVNNIYYFKNHKNFGLARKLFFYIKTCILTCLFLFPEHYHTVSNLSLRKKIKSLIRQNDYNFILLHYWWIQKLLPENLGNASLIIDTHGLLFEKVYLEADRQKGFVSKKIDIIYADIYKKKELSSINEADILIFNSEKDKIRYTGELGGKVDSILIPNGQDLNYFAPENYLKSENTILFYGSLGGLQNQVAFKRFWNNIYPLILKENKNIHLVILGNGPPEWVRDLQNEKIKVTGYVDDIRPFIAESTVCVLPLTIGAGFRGRVVEVMAMGVPVVGTHNALDNLNMINGVHGYITDDDKEMAEYVLEILKNDKLRVKLSANCKSFIYDNFSIESTYGRLSSIIGNQLIEQ